MCRWHILYKIYLTILLGIGSIWFPSLSSAAPQGGQVESGTISIGSDTAKGIDTLITQQSQKGIINWQSFNIGATEHTHFAQPGASAVTLNRIAGVDPSSILGQLTATGKIFLVNPAGILFGPSARIDVAGLVATTANISSENFLAGKYYFVQGLENNAKIINQGYIKIADNGIVYLVAPGIENAGVIEARLGKVVLAASPANSAYTLDFYGDQLIQFALPQNMGSLIDNAITQKGRISAPGGRVLLTANSANSVVNNVINMSGVIEASTINNMGGEIVLSGGKKGVVSVTGSIIARGNNSGEHGGLVKIVGEKVGLFQNANVDVSGMAGGGEVLIGADYVNNSITSAAQAVYVDPTAVILANALDSGSGGRIIVLSDNSTRFYGTASAKGGPEGGSGGFVETSGNWLDVYGAHVDVSAVKGHVGTWLLDPRNLEIVAIPPSSGGAWSGVDTLIWTPSADNSKLFVDDILTNLASADVEINTGSTGFQAGNIDFNAILNYTGANVRTLSLIAANNININGAIIGTNLNFIMSTLSPTGIISINNGINVRNLTVQATGTTHINTSAINTLASQIYNNPVVLGADTILSAGNGITFNSTINGPHNLTLGAGTGDILFNGDVGSYANSIGALSIISANNVTANNIFATSFVQASGTGVTRFNGVLYVGPGSGLDFIHGTGTAGISTNSVEGNIDLGLLYLNVTSAHLNGFIGGDPTILALLNIRLLNNAGPGMRYFNGTDLYALELINTFINLSDPLVIELINTIINNIHNTSFLLELLATLLNKYAPMLAGILNNAQIQSILNSLQQYYNVILNYQSTDMVINTNILDYLFFIEPIICA